MNPIAKLNDAFRISGPGPGWIITRGIADRDPAFQLLASQTVRGFSDFKPDNDPYGEHDFGAFEIAGTKLFWKIDCYDHQDMTCGSADPANPAVTCRILTIMLASEY
jgi:hypothetical protein